MNRATKKVNKLSRGLSSCPTVSSEINRQEFFVEAQEDVRLFVVAKAPAKGGIGKATLLVHGSGVGFECWDIPLRDYSVMDYLARRGIDTYAVQCRGYGESTKPNGMHVSARLIASDLKTVVSVVAKYSKVSRVSLIGHCGGNSRARGCRVLSGPSGQDSSHGHAVQEGEPAVRGLCREGHR